MLRKLLKYDLKAVFKFWWIIAVVTLGASLLGGIGFRIIIESTTDLVDDPIFVLLTIGGFILFIVGVMVIASSFLLTEVLIFWRFYKNLFTDEGYLTFTLPVSRKQILLSKTINAMIWSALHMVVLFISVFIILLIAPPSSGDSLFDPTAVSVVTTAFSSLFSGIGAWAVLYVIEIIIMVFFYFLFFVSLIHMCITIGSVIAKKLKLLAAIGIFYAINMVTSFASQIFTYLLPLIFDGSSLSFLSNASDNTLYLIGGLFLLIICAVCATLAFTVYCITQRLLDRKLNLA